MAEFENLDEDFSVTETLFEGEVDMAWFKFYEQPFPPVVRHYLKDIMDNWVKLEFYATDDPAFAERVLGELQSKANQLPISDVNAVAREEISSFVRSHMDNPSHFLEMISNYWNKEMMASGEEAEESNLVKTLSKATYDLKKKLTYIIQSIVTETSTAYSPELTQEIQSYYNDLVKVIRETAGIKAYVLQTLDNLRSYQVREADCEKFYIREMAEWWKSLLLTIENLHWQVGEITKYCKFEQGFPDLNNLDEAIEELVSSSMIIVESPRLNERTLRVKKKKVTYALQIILPDLDDGANLVPSLLSEEGFTRLRQQPPTEDPTSTDLGTTSLYTREQPVIKDPNSGNYKCVFSELGFENMARERKRNRAGSVMNIKLVYMFRAFLKYRGHHVWARCFSMPVVTSSHNDQSVQGTATLFWDDYFQEGMRFGLETRTNVSWNEIASALKNLIFRQTGRRITDLNLAFLRSTFLGRKREEVVFDDDEQRFQMTDLLKPMDSDRGLSFWEWLWGTLQLLTAKENKFLLNLWKNGYVVGYISQEKVHEAIQHLLDQEVKNYFILRFSKRDGKSIVLQGYIESPDPSKEPYGIFSVMPYKLDHLRETPLQQRIMKRRDCNWIVYQSLSGGWGCETKENVFQPDEQVRRIVQLPEGYVGREMSEQTERVPKNEPVETEMVTDDFDVTNRVV